MERALTHECDRTTMREFEATISEPYHFTDSGLNHVYLIGIKYYKCVCGQTLADIPAIKQLLSLIARDLVEKSDALAGEEIRFLRKRLRKKQIDFAKELGIRPETLSRIETGEIHANERTDKLLRLSYVIQSEDPLLSEVRSAILEMLASWKRCRKPSKIVATVKDNEWESKLAAAA